MFQDLIEYLKKELKVFNLRFVNVGVKIVYFQTDKYNFAYDVVNDGSEVGVYLVIRPGHVHKEFFLKKHPELREVNKIKLVTLSHLTSFDVIKNLILNNYFELISNYNNFNSIYERKVYCNDNKSFLKYDEPIKVWFSDGVKNFGDFVTPWLMSNLTGRSVLNVRHLPSSNNAILGVGSIVQYVPPNHKDIKVWGSGLISSENHPNIAKKLKGMRLSKVYACRGELTKNFFVENEFECSNVLGDPALLFSRLFEPIKSSKYKYAIVPHHIHYHLFKDLDIDNCIIVDVRNELTKVISDIANASFCVSTSLHGLIIAQSYGVPWTHLFVEDGRQLIGEFFKFKDFFSILEEQDVSLELLNSSEINRDNIMRAFQKSYSPRFKNTYSADALIDSLFESIS